MLVVIIWLHPSIVATLICGMIYNLFSIMLYFFLVSLDALVSLVPLVPLVSLGLLNYLTIDRVNILSTDDEDLIVDEDFLGISLGIYERFVNTGSNRGRFSAYTQTILIGGSFAQSERIGSIAQVPNDLTVQRQIEGISLIRHWRLDIGDGVFSVCRNRDTKRV